MIFINTIILSLIISIDSFLLCLLNKNNNRFNYFITPFIFSFFQITFLLIGYFLGNSLESYLDNYLKYIIFIIFSSMGIKLITDTLINKGKEKTCHFTLKDIIFQAIMTSCDSLFLGLPLAFSGSTHLFFSLIVGLTTFFVCLIGLLLRNKIENDYDDKINIAGSIILFVFAFKSLL